jgi:hypothetical protein
MTEPHFPLRDTSMLWSECQPVGSRITCNPPPMDTDRDWLVYVHSTNWQEFIAFMINDGWKIGGSEPEHFDAANYFNSFTKDIEATNENVIATSDYAFYLKFSLATQVSKKLNIMSKVDRITLFQAILYERFA